MLSNEPTIHFVSGLPRTGSTLLMNVLGQNPQHHVTPTSGLIEIIMGLRSTWKNHIEFKAEGLEKVKHRIQGAMKGMIYGYFENELKEGKIVFDKSRGWLNYIEHLEDVLGKRVKVLVPIRDVREILASFEKVYRTRGIEYNYPPDEHFFNNQTLEGRCEDLLKPSGVVGVAINRLRDALTRKGDRLLIIPFRAFTSEPQTAMKLIHQFLELDPFEYNFDEIKQVTHENDLWHGMKLHTIQSKIKSSEKPSWPEILPKKYADSVAQRFKDINDLAR
jgi:sulfotransferase